jgi:membrane-bound metal-dependent hydrolase YbcI (DUF457 family)
MGSRRSLSGSFLPAAASFAVILAVDALSSDRQRTRMVAGILDETAHLATGLLVVCGTNGWRDRRWSAGVIAGSILLDADHLPGSLGWGVLQPGSSRPVPHSLAAPLGAVLIGIRSRGRKCPAATGTAIGLGFHLVRDLATPLGGPGVALFRPVKSGDYSLPYRTYAGILAAFLGASFGHARRVALGGTCGRDRRGFSAGRPSGCSTS